MRVTSKMVEKKLFKERYGYDDYAEDDGENYKIFDYPTEEK